ncbi:MAG TPA: ferredoxin [Acidimicrobiales bacterium]|nr:ferredoxin [Acidimicrobiales bacterium]
MRVRIDEERCSGHGRCYTLAPDLFDTDDRGYGVVKLEGEVSPELEDSARLAEASCPEQAIELSD